VPILDPQRAAVLALSCTLESLAGYPNNAGLLERAAKVLHAARRAQVPVVHGIVRFRPGYPEVGPRSGFGAMKAAGRLKDLSPENAPHPALDPQPSDILLTKRRAGAFFGTDLDLILRAQGRTTLALLGVRTSGAVLRTFCWALDADYDVLVVSDCCADLDQELHDVLLRKLYGRQALTADEFVVALTRPV